MVLYGALAATGKGHLTDEAILDVMNKTEKPVTITWLPDIFLERHPNAVKFRAFSTADYSSADQPLYEMTVYSVGGGAIEIEGDEKSEGAEIYALNNFTDIMH